MISRRAVLVGLGALGGTVGVAVVTEVQAPGPVTPQDALRVLDARAFSALVALAEVIVPAAPGLPTTAEVGVAERVDAVLYAMPEGAAHEVKIALHLLESPVVGALTGRSPRPFSRLDPDARVRAFDSWRDSRFANRRTVWKALGALVKAAYWSDPRVDAFVGYERLRFAP